MYLRIIVLSSLLLEPNCLSLCFGASPSPFDQKAFDAQTRADRLAITLAGLREHNSALDNARFDVESQETSVNPTGRSVRDRTIRVITSGHKYRCEFETTLPTPAGKSVKETLKIAWDGNRWKQWHLIEGNPHAGEIIDSVERDERSFEYFWSFTDQLGIRCHDKPHVSISDFLEQMLGKKEIQCDAMAVKVDGYDCVKLTALIPSRVRAEWIIDAARQFLIRRYTQFNIKEDGTFAPTVDTVTKATIEIDGTLIPSEFERIVKVEQPKKGGNAPSGTYSFTTVYKITKCELGNVKDEDIIAGFMGAPTTTLVIDDEKEISYQVDKDGRQKPVLFQNAKTGKVTGMMPSTAPSTQPLGKD